MIFSVDGDMRYIAFTKSYKDAIKNIFGAEIVVGQNLLGHFQREDDRNRVKDKIEQALKGKFFVIEEEYGGDSSGHRCWWENRYSPIFDQERNIVGVTVLAIDISQRKQEETVLHVNEMNYRSIMDQAVDGIFIADSSGRYLDVNRSGCEMLGYTLEEFLMMNISDLPANKSLPLGIEELLEGKTLVREWELLCKDGSTIFVEISARMTKDKCLLGLVRDITERKVAVDELRRTKEAIEQINLTLRRAFEREQLASRTDSLTGVFNRRYFFELLEYEFLASRQHDRPLSIVMFDVDFLKKTNDAFGHTVGDELLKKVTEAVCTQLSFSDMLARYGGDEFAILLSDSSEQDAFMLLERIYRELENTYVYVGEKKVTVSISAGISSIRADMEKADQLVILADQALYIAKNAGRNRMAIFEENKN